MTTVYGSTLRAYNGALGGWRAFLTHSESDLGDVYSISCNGGFGSDNWGFQITYNTISSTLSCTGQSSYSNSRNVYTANGTTVNLPVVPDTSDNKITYTFTKTKLPQTVTLSCSTKNESGYISGTSVASTTITIPALDSYTILYDANGGTGAPSSHTKYYGESTTLSSVRPTRTNYEFLGWSTSSTATAATYSPGQTYSSNANLTLYAVWKLSYVAPSIYSVSVDRCDSDGTLNDFGTSVRIKFNWSCSQIIGTNNVSNITVGYRISGSGSYKTKSLTVSGTSGSIIHVGGINDISLDDKYDISILVKDTLGASMGNPNGTTYITTIPSAKFVLDFKAGGKGVAIGKASVKDCLEIAMDTEFSGSIYINEGVELGEYIDNKINTLDVGTVYNEEVLYENESGTYGTIELNADVNDYKHLEIEFMDGSRFMTQHVYMTQDGKNVAIERIVTDVSNGVTYIGSQILKLTGKSITQSHIAETILISKNGSQEIQINDGEANSEVTKLKVTRVIGWK